MRHLGTITLETPRLLLRRFTPVDAQAMYENWAADPEVTKFLTWPAHESPAVIAAVLKDWVDSYRQPDFYQWAIVPKEVGQPSAASESYLRMIGWGRPTSATALAGAGGIEDSCPKPWRR